MKKMITLMLAAVLMLTCMTGVALAAEPGETVTVEFYAVDNPGFASFGAKLNYDGSVLELVSIEAGEKCTGDGMFVSYGDMVSFINVTDVTGDGLLFTATFTVKADAEPGTYEVSAAVDDPENAVGEAINLVISGGSVTVDGVVCEHEWDEGVVTTAATCEGEGVMTCTCTKCGRTKTETIPALGHNSSENILYEYDEEGHWTVCECGQQGERETHAFENNGFCKCGYKDPNFNSGINTTVILLGAIGLIAVVAIVVIAANKRKKAKRPAKGRFAKRG